MPMPVALHFAIALRLNRSKPNEISVREHILNLRQFMSPIDPNPSAHIQTDYTIDQAGYWKFMYNNAVASKNQLQNKVLELERMIESNKSAPTDTDANATQQPSQAKKLQRRNGKPNAVLVRSDDIFLDEIQSLPTSRKSALLRCLLAIQRQQESDVPVDIDYLAKACHELTKILSETAKEGQPVSEEVFLITQRCIVILLHAFRAHASDNTEAAQLIHAFVTLFRDSVLNPLTTLSKDGSLRGHAELGYAFLATLDPRKFTPKPRSKTGLLTPPQFSDIIEGVLHLLLDRAGALIYILTFSKARQKSIEDEILSHFTEPSIETLQHAREEAKFLTPLLDLALSMYTKQEDNAARKQDIAQSALTKLQNTLIVGIFGPHENAFKEVLHLPAEVELDVTPQELRREGQDWFVTKMWDMCGWDILARSTDVAE